MKRQAQLSAKKRKRIIFLGSFAAAALLLLILWNIRIDTVYVEGDAFYTDEEIENYIFETSWERNYFYAYLNNRFGEKKSIPFVAGYTMEFDGTDCVTVTVYEKNIVGYINYMGSHMYFDKDGTVVESSSRILWDGIPLITGLDFDSIVLYRPLPVKDETTFTQILNLTQLINKHGIAVDKIYFNSRMEATLYTDEVRVLLGDKSNMEDKMAELAGMLPQLTGLSGVLHLESYDPAAMNPRYSFIKDPEPVETESDGTE